MSVEQMRTKEHYTFADLKEIVAILRSPEGCPWDREQTHESIRNNFLEEVYEAVDALDQKDLAGLREELGDVLLQVVFHARLEEEVGGFSLEDVCDEICRKMVIRHPHVFGEQIIGDDGTPLRDWEAIKEKTHERTSAEEALRAIPRALPALMRAEKLGKKSRKCGFDWQDSGEAMQKVREELDEVQEAMADGNIDSVREEFGDLLLAVANAARLAGVCAEEALTGANDKYIERLSLVERQCLQSGRAISDLERTELLSFWKNAKETRENTEKIQKNANYPLQKNE